MSLSEENLNGKTLQQCKAVLENALVNYYDSVNNTNPLKYRKYINYSDYYKIIIRSNISTNVKKSLILAIKNFGIPPPNRWSDDCLEEAFKQKDISLIKFVSTLLKTKPSRDVVSFCKRDLTEDDNQFVIQLLNEVPLSITIKKAFLYGAIVIRNMVLIRYIVETQGIDLFVPTHQKVNHALGRAFAKNDDLELLQWFEDHEYNIHESQRSVLNAAYEHNAQRIIKYVLDRQTETDAANLFMEKVSSQAFRNNDVSMLQKFPKIDFRVTQHTICTALTSQKPYIYIQVLFDRWVEILKVKKHKYGWSGKTADGEIALFTTYHAIRFYKSSQYDNLWSLISNQLYKYGDTACRAKLVQLGYTVGAVKQTVHTPTKISQNRANLSDDEIDEEEDEDADDEPTTFSTLKKSQVDNIESDDDDDDEPPVVSRMVTTNVRKPKKYSDDEIEDIRSDDLAD